MLFLKVCWIAASIQQGQNLFHLQGTHQKADAL